jgi:TP901 family phage tail tape measure protein
MPIPPAILTLFADTKEATAKLDEVGAKMDALGAQTDAAGSKFTSFGSKAATAVLGLGVAVAAYSVDQGYKLTESMDQLQNATGMTNAQIKALTQTIIGISDKTGSSTADLATSFATVAQAGIKGAAAIALVDAASKAALATNTNVTTVTQSLVAAQALQFAKGMDIAKLTGILVAGSHNYVGGLTAEVAMLQGKVGTALSSYGVGLKTAIELGSTFAKVGLPTRSITSFVNGIGKLEAPIKTTTDSSGKLTHGISGYALALNQADINQSKLVSDIKTGNLAGMLAYLKDVAVQTKQPLSEVMNLVFGTSGGAAASLLAKSPAAIKQVTEALSGAGSGSLNKAFTTASQQFGNQMKIIEENLKNSAAQFGLVLIPYLQRAATFVENALTSLEHNPAERKALEIDLGITFAAALALKIAQALQSTVQTGLLTEIAANTAASAAEGGATAAEGGVVAGTVAGGGEAAASGILGRFSAALGKFGIGTDALAAAAPALVVLAGQKGASAQDVTARINAKFYDAKFSAANFDAKSLDIPGFNGESLPGTRTTTKPKPKGKVTINTKVGFIG